MNRPFVGIRQIEIGARRTVIRRRRASLGRLFSSSPSPATRDLLGVANVVSLEGALTWRTWIGCRIFRVARLFTGGYRILPYSGFGFSFACSRGVRAKRTGESIPTVCL